MLTTAHVLTIDDLIPWFFLLLAQLWLIVFVTSRDPGTLLISGIAAAALLLCALGMAGLLG